MREPKKERMYRVAFNTLYFSGTFFPPQFVTVSRYTMRQFQASSSDCATYGLRIRIVRPDQIRSDQRGINQFECFHFVPKICRHLLHKPQSGLCMHVQACAGMCMLPLPVAHPHPVPVAILRQVV